MAEEEVWVNKIRETREDGRLCDWVTSLHSQKLHCQLLGGFLNGSFNLGQSFIFDDVTIWFLRLPRASSVAPEYADEKVAMELEALRLIGEKTLIPVPEIYAWGFAKDNPLGLGPYILMEFIEGVSLGNVFIAEGCRILKEEIPDAGVEYVYRQMTQFMLQLSQIDFDQIGNLPTARTKYPAPRRPLTWKAHEILRVGGVNRFVPYPRFRTLLTTTDDQEEGLLDTEKYFRLVNQQDWKQLREQPNSICGSNTARSRYASLKILESLIPEMTNPVYNHGPFRLICDNFRPANMTVRSKEDLTIVGVVDLEWVYAGPAQLFAFQRFDGFSWIARSMKPGTLTERRRQKSPIATSKHLDIFKRVLEEEESKMIDRDKDKKKLSELVKWSEDSGAMWFHMLISSGFFDSSTFPCMQPRNHKGAECWDARLREYEETEEVKSFVNDKLKDLEPYDEITEKVEHYQALMDKQEMELDAFIESVSALLISD